MSLIKRIQRRLPHGRAGDRAAEVIFDGAFYGRTNPDVAAETDLFGHYLRHGWAEGRSPSALFDNDWYLTFYADVAEAGMNPLIHYVRAGAKEGRNPCLLFDTQWYLQRNPDVAANGVNPLAHFIEDGASELRDPSPFFNVQWYLNRYGDEIHDGVNPLNHYIEVGAGKRYDPSSDFSTTGYLRRCPDAKADPTPLHHFVRCGAKESKALADVSEGSKGASAFAGASSLTELTDIAAHTDFLSLPDSIRQQINAAAQRAPFLISIVMPTWNRQHVISRAIDSVFAQTYQHFELLIADDGSTDDTVEFLRNQYRSLIEVAKIKIIEGEHAGVSAARNNGLRVAKGDLIAYLDSDNAWRPTALATYAAAFSSAPSATSVYTPILIRSDSTEDRDGRVIANPFNRTQLLKSNYIDLNGFAHRRELVGEYGDFNENLRRLVDWELIIRFTKDRKPFYAPIISTDYFLSKAGLQNITHVEPLGENYEKIVRIHRKEYLDLGLISHRKAAELWANDDFRKNEIVALYQAAPGRRQGADKCEMTLILDSDQLAKLDRDQVAKDYWFVGNVLVNEAGTLRTLDGEIEEKTGGVAVYWPTSIDAMLGPSALMNAFLALVFNGLDLALVSHKGHESKPNDLIYGKFLRDQVILAGKHADSWVSDMSLPHPLRGRILRLETRRFGESPAGKPLKKLLRGDFEIDQRAQEFWSTSVAFDRKTPEIPVARLPKLAADKPSIAAVGMKVAVGGVERLTLNIARELGKKYQSLYVALEPTLDAQGSIADEISDGVDLLFDCFEILPQSRFGAFFDYLRLAYDPQMIFIMNGSMWLAANANLLRDAFPKAGLVDQQVYDHEVGWIQRYHEPGIQRFDRFVAVNSKILEAFRNRGISESRIDYIHHAIDVDRVSRSLSELTPAAARTEFDLPADKFTTIFAGRLTEQKRPLDFLALAERRRERKDEFFVLLGDGVMRETCEEAIAEKKLENIKYIPFVKDISRIYRGVDVLAVTSEYEGLPLVVVEAACMGLPIISTDVGEIRTTIDQFGAGHIYHPIGDVDALAEVFGQIRTNWRTFKKQAEANSSKASSHFSIEHVASLYEAAGLKALTQREAPTKSTAA